MSSDKPQKTPQLRCCNSCGRDCYTTRPSHVPAYCGRCVGKGYQVTEERSRKMLRPLFQIDSGGVGRDVS